MNIRMKISVWSIWVILLDIFFSFSFCLILDLGKDPLILFVVPGSRQFPW